MDRLVTRASNIAINGVVLHRRKLGLGEPTFYSAILTCGTYISLGLLLTEPDNASGGRSLRTFAYCIRDAVDGGYKLHLDDLVWFVSACALYPAFRNNPDKLVRVETIMTLARLTGCGRRLEIDAAELESLFDAPRPASKTPGAVPMWNPQEQFVERLVELAATRLINRADYRVEGHLELLYYGRMMQLGYKIGAEQM
jgi:hypothetical protein